MRNDENRYRVLRNLRRTQRELEAMHFKTKKSNSLTGRVLDFLEANGIKEKKMVINFVPDMYGELDPTRDPSKKPFLGFYIELTIEIGDEIGGSSDREYKEFVTAVPLFCARDHVLFLPCKADTFLAAYICVQRAHAEAARILAEATT